MYAPVRPAKIDGMGFALWIDGDVACAQGTHEYRPLGVAVISVTDLFSHRDFRPRRGSRPRDGAAFVGLFASLAHVNRFLLKLRSHGKQKKIRQASRRLLSIV